MSAADIAVAASLTACVASALLSCIGIIAFRDFFVRLHFLSVTTTVSSFSLLVAVVIKEGWGQATIKTILVAMVLLLINAVLTHATARAARVREMGHWTPDPEEHIQGTTSRDGRKKG